MQKVTFTNSRGDSIELAYQSPFFLNKIEGLGDVDADIQNQKAPGQDGSTHIATTLAERFISMEVVILKDLQNNRQLISKVFNPKLGEGILVYENDVVKREIKAIPEHVPTFPDVRPSPVKTATIDLICNNPFWLTEEKVHQLVVWEGGFKFPLKLPTKMGFMSSSKAKTLVNDGDDETPINVVFNGPATSPIKIINVTTGEYIEVNQNLLAGEKIEINTAFGQKRVTKILSDGSKLNAFHYITLGSSFFNLIVGNNIIDYSTGADYERAAVQIAWHNRFLSV